MKTGPFINVPPKIDPKEGVEIFPDQSNEIDQATIFKADPGNEETKARLSGYMNILEKVYDKDLINLRGGNHGKELFLDQVHPAEGRSSIDGSGEYVPTGGRILLTDEDVRADRETPRGRKERQEVKVRINMETKDVYIGVPKPRRNEEPDLDIFETKARELKAVMEAGDISKLGPFPLR